MNGPAERATGVVARTVGNTVSPVTAALLASAGIALSSPALATWAIPASALAGALTEEGITLIQRAWQDRSDRVQEFADIVTERVGMPVDEFLVQESVGRRARLLLSDAVAATTETHDEWKIETLAEAFVRGAQDTATI